MLIFESRGDHVFETVASKLWCNLPQPVRMAESVVCFKQLRKRVIFFLNL